MKTMTFKCDKCGEECSGKDTIRLESVGVFWGSFMPHAKSVCKSQDWCLICRKKIGAVSAVNGVPPATFVPPTLEDMIREIVREEVTQE